jgi:hypothetical protein
VEDDRFPYQALDASAMPVRDAKRRGNGWLLPDMPTYRLVQQPGLVGGLLPFERRWALRSDHGLLLRCRLYTADQPLAETFFNLRAEIRTPGSSAAWARPSRELT